MKYLQNLLHNCKEASLLAIKSKEEKISLRQKLEMRFHLYICKCCRNFQKQSVLIDEALKIYFEPQQSPLKMPEDFKAKIKENLK